MTPALIVEWRAEFLVHVSTRSEWCAEGVGHAVDGTAAFDFPGSAEGGDAARFVSFGHAGWTVHLDFLPEHPSILLNLLGELNRRML